MSRFSRPAAPDAPPKKTPAGSASFRPKGSAAVPPVPSEHAPAPAAAPTNPNASGWAAWSLTAPVFDGQQSWATTDCPRCVRSGAQSSIQAHAEGWFWCGVCGHHGHAPTRPAQYRGSFLTVWRRFVADGAWNATWPLDQPWSAIKEVDAVQAPAWLGDQWCVAWHLLCRSDDDKEATDAFIVHPTTQQWSRLRHGTPTPLAWNQATSARVVLVADPLDLAVLHHAGVSSVACLPPDMNAHLPTAPSWRVLEAMEERLKVTNEIVLATRSTKEARALEDEMGRRMDRERCFRVRWFSPNDQAHHEELGPVQALEQYGADQVRMMVEVAPPFPVVGLYELHDVEDRFDELYEKGLTPGVATGWPMCDRNYTVKPGQWTLVTGIPGHGKSTWLDALLVNLASMHGWRFGMFSPENQPVERHFASLMEKKIGKPFSEGPTPRITPEEKDRAKRWLNDKFKVILPDEDDGVWTLDAVLRLAKILVLRYGIRGLVIDPWNELDHSRAAKVNETDHISESLTKIRRFARLYDVHVWIVAHPTKLEKQADGRYPVPTPYNVSGGAHWRNKADNALSIYRYVDEDDFDVVDIHVQKIRFREVGRVGIVSLRCELSTGRYIDDIDQEKRMLILNKNQHQNSSSMRTRTPREYPQGEALDYEHAEIF